MGGCYGALRLRNGLGGGRGTGLEAPAEDTCVAACYPDSLTAAATGCATGGPAAVGQ